MSQLHENEFRNDYGSFQEAGPHYLQDPSVDDNRGVKDLRHTLALFVLCAVFVLVSLPVLLLGSLYHVVQLRSLPGAHHAAEESQHRINDDGHCQIQSLLNDDVLIDSRQKICHNKTEDQPYGAANNFNGGYALDLVFYGCGHSMTSVRKVGSISEKDKCKDNYEE